MNLRTSSSPGFATTVAEAAVEADLLDAVPALEHRPLDSLPTIGHVGRYALKHVLGEGGLGTVYAAIDPLLSRPVAVKTLHVQLCAGDGFEQILLHEARAAAALSHPHIVTVHDAGISDDSVYLAMEKLDGLDLRHLLARGWRPQVRQAALIVRRIAEALAYAHGKGVIHCDIKPANIFMVGRTSPKVLDFGIARVAQRPDFDTRALAGGSPYYMAPEQVRGDAIDRRCDVYSLGVVLYELLTGRRAFAGATLDEITDAVLHRVPAPAHAVSPRVPDALSAIAARAMAKDPNERHRSARELARELRQWLGEEPPPRRRRTRSVAKRWRLAAVAAVLVAGATGFALFDELQDEARAHASPEPRGVPLVVTAAAAPPDVPAAEPTVAPVIAAVGSAPVHPAVTEARGAAPSAALEAAPAAEPELLLAAGPSGVKRAPPRRAGPRDASRVAPAPAAPTASPPPEGIVRLAVSPWGEVEVDGAAAGTAPPMHRLSLPAGRHTIVIRNADFAPFSTIVDVKPDEPVTVRHRFGS